MNINMKKIKRFITLILALALAMTVLAGCEFKLFDKKVKEVEQKNEEDNPAASVIEYPLDSKGVTLTYWKQTSVAVQKTAQNYGDLPFAKALEKKTGVKVEYTHPSLTNAQEEFMRMLASGSFTDILGWNFNSYTGGAQAAIDGGVILSLNNKDENIIEKWAPDYKKLLESYPDTVAKEAKTDKGNYYAFGLVASNRVLNTTAGPIVRGDWLEDLDIDAPKTIDEWYNMLKAFKEEKGATAPLSMSMQGFYCGFISGAYGVNMDFYRDGDVVKYAPIEPGYKQYLETMNKWYSEGLFDKEFDTTTVTQNLLTGKSGATWNAIGGGIGTLMTNVEAKPADDPNAGAKFIGVPYPTLDGSKSEFSQLSASFGAYVSLSTSCKDVELAAKWLNYGYTEEGHMLFNFGLTEEDAKEIGIDTWSYELVDKDGDGTKEYPQYTDEVKSNPDGLTMQEAFAKYSQAGGASGGGLTYQQDPRYMEQYAVRPEQMSAWKVWADTNAPDHYVPNTGVASEDSSEYSQIYTDVSTYVSMEQLKFIKGDRPISEFDDYVATLKNMGVDKIIKMRQNAYDAYLAR